MANDLKAKIAARLKKIIGKKPIVDVPGASGSYIYRLMKGEQNVTIDRLDIIVRAYGSSLGEFFQPWRDSEPMLRQKLIVEIRQAMDRILASDVDLSGLVELVRLMDPGDPNEPRI